LKFTALHVSQFLTDGVDVIDGLDNLSGFFLVVVVAGDLALELSAELIVLSHDGLDLGLQ